MCKNKWVTRMVVASSEVLTLKARAKETERDGERQRETKRVRERNSDANTRDG